MKCNTQESAAALESNVTLTKILQGLQPNWRFYETLPKVTMSSFLIWRQKIVLSVKKCDLASLLSPEFNIDHVLSSDPDYFEKATANLNSIIFASISHFNDEHGTIVQCLQCREVLEVEECQREIFEYSVGSQSLSMKAISKRSTSASCR